MTKKQHIILAILLGIVMTLVINLSLTKAIIFGGYLDTKEILSGGDYYLSLVNESSRGNWNMGSPFIKEWADKEYLYPALNINIAGLFKMVFNLDLKTASIALSYLCIFIIAILAIITFLFVFRFHYFGYLAAAAFMFFPRMIGWGQVISPQTNFIFLTLFLLFYFWPVSEPAPRTSLGIGVNSNFWKREIGMAIFAGLLFYTYPYHWTYALPLLVLTDLWEFFKEKRIDWKRMIKYPVILLISSWYLVNLWHISHLSYYRETMVRIGALYNRLPAGILTQTIIFIFILSAVIIYRYIFLKNNFRINFDLSKIIIGLLVTFIVLNQQLITGMQLEFNSHYLPVIFIFAIALVGALALIFLDNLRYSRFIITIVIWLTVLFFVGRFIYANATADFHSRLSAKELEVIEWLIQNGINNKVIYAPRQLNAPINLLTDNYLYFHDSEEVHLIPTEELIDRFTYFDLMNRGITDNLIGQQVNIFGQTFKSSWQKDNVSNHIKALLSGKSFVPATLESYTKYDFRPMRQKRLYPDLKDFKEYLEKYHVDYLVYEAKYRNSIYKNVPGIIVFDNGFYIIKNKQN